MNSKFRYDKKQLPQVIVMGVLSLALFGYFGWKMASPQSASAAKPAAPAQTASASSPAAAPATAGTPASSAAPATVDSAPANMIAIAPTSGMRDPFAAPAGTDIKPAAPPRALPPPPSRPMPSLPQIQPIALPGQLSVPGLPHPMIATPPPPPARPNWQVTGVVMGGSGTNNVAILRDGEQRRYVRTGQMVDGEYRVEAVDQDGVTLTRGSEKFRLVIGAAGAGSQHVPTPNGASTLGISSNLNNHKTGSVGI